MFKVLVCGSREFTDRVEVNRVLDALHAKHGKNLLLISGGAVGADNLAHQWASSRKVDHLILYAKWEVEGKAAGPIRNRRMLKRKPKLVVAFMVNDPSKSKNRGTRDMCAIAADAGIKVKRFTS